ncbi:sigma-70 family RNA polymerase sigma factor [Parabacteroides sp. 52]|uniref:RNA polymerase sigma factor n=1 Tax=unclassified Parabacteroides TaxID=2649774 RepID=UPI0013D2A2CC|nr:MULTISPECIES: sigma-70 family RNA polymerase sigma factor [unclassified Parabacteroides]MDH6534642.1 RNA polymerase sigma factor (sigma-70 family) [Parabacteroides sp. PM5-20]NDV56110.1 sigma-70 family RNA polymerase sigma factor [Parabacteroides sp. 52]
MNNQPVNPIDTLYRTYVHDLFSYALNLGFDRETSKDAIHDVFFKICQREEIVDKAQNIQFYLLRSLKNRLLDIYKQRRETAELPADPSADEMPFTIHVTIEDQIIQTEEIEQTRQKVEQLLHTLTDRQREIIYLRYNLDLDYDEIAELMKITVPACRKLTHKAISKLKKSPYSAVLLLFLIG